LHDLTAMPALILPPRELLYRHAPRLLQGAAIVAIASGIGLWGALLLAPHPDPAPPMLVTQAPPSHGLEPLEGWFGSGKGRLQVRITGLMAAGERSTAVLSIDGAPARAYRIGDALAPGITLSAVQADAIVINQDGLDETVPAPARPAPVRGFVPVADPPASR